MAAEMTWSTWVHTVTVNAAGDIDGFVDVSRSGDRGTIVSVNVGSVLIRMHTSRIARRVRDGWRQTGLHVDSLPERVSEAAHQPPNAWPVGVVMTMGDAAPIVSQFFPLDERRRRPAWVRIQTGPVVWQVLDRRAWYSIAALWELTCSSFRA